MHQYHAPWPIYILYTRYLLQVDFELKQIVAYDSLPEEARKADCAKALRAVHRFVSDIHLLQKESPFDWSGWGQAHVRVCDQSGPDWYNCGVFAYLSLWCLARRATISLLQDVAPPSLTTSALASRVARWREQFVLWLRTGKVPV